jgi:6-phosphogluconolactonase
MINQIDYTSRDALMAGIASAVEAELRHALTLRDTVSLAVPGGTTPAPFFEILRDADIEWSRVNILLTDERFVPETSDRSNTRLIMENLFKSNASAARHIPMYSAADAAEDVIDDLSAAIAKILPIDVCVLGMGTDRHTASLFPEADQLELGLSDNAPILLPMRAPGAPEPRITLTAPVLRSAKHCHVLLTGSAKKAALNIALEEGQIQDAPIRVVLGDTANTTIHYAD